MLSKDYRNLGSEISILGLLKYNVRSASDPSLDRRDHLNAKLRNVECKKLRIVAKLRNVGCLDSLTRSIDGAPSDADQVSSFNNPNVNKGKLYDVDDRGGGGPGSQNLDDVITIIRMVPYRRNFMVIRY